MSANVSHDELVVQFVNMKSNLDQMFLIVFGMFVLFMQGGFAFLEAGSIRSKNVTNIIIKNVLDMFIGALSFWAVGYSFAFGEPGNAFIGHNHFFSSNVVWNDDELLGAAEVSASVHFAVWFHQFVCAATASTIVSGAMAERTEFGAYLFYCCVLTAVVYPVVAHCCWAPDGWLKNGVGTGLSYQDFGGSGVVHMTGGTAAFVGAVIIGPRLGRFNEDGTDNAISGHSVTVASIGAFILFVGLIAFNGGSQLQISSPGDGKVIALAVVNTIISGASSALTSMFVYKLTDAVLAAKSYWSLIISINGGLAGMVAICAGCNDVQPWAAMLIGVVAGFGLIGWHHLVIFLRIDDPLDSVAVHFGGGLTGVLLTPIFATNGLRAEDGKFVGGIVYSSDNRAYQQFGWNLLGAVFIIAWAGGVSWLMFATMRRFGWLRVSEAVERSGLDDVKHGEPAYPRSSYVISDHVMTSSVRPSKLATVDETESNEINASPVAGTPPVTGVNSATLL